MIIMTQINSKCVSKWINNKRVQMYKCHTKYVFSLPYYCVWIVFNKWDKCGRYSHELPLIGFLSIMFSKCYSKWRETLDNKSFIFFFFLVERVVKPKENKTENENTTDKPKRKKKGQKGRKNRKNKKKNPCNTKFKNFCIHGECSYIENLKTVSCK